MSKKKHWILEQREKISKLLKPEIIYDKEVDILNIWFGGNLKTKHCVESEEGVIFDLSNKDLIIGLEIMGFSKYLDQKRTKKIYAEHKKKLTQNPKKKK